MLLYRSESVARRKGAPRIFVIPLGGLSLLLIYLLISHKQASTVISPIPEDHAPSQSILTRLFRKEKSPDQLRRSIADVINNRWVNYSVYVKDLRSDFTMGINENVIYTAASVNKLPILAALYYNVQQGNIDLDRVITLQENDIQDYGTGSLRYDQPGSSYSIKTLVKLMIGQSDNTAAYILANEILNINEVQSLVDSWNMTQTDMINNKTSNRDIETLMEKIYTGKVANQAYTLEMLSFLKDTDFEDRIPAQLPNSAIIYHKTGTEVGILHDTGIVEDGNLKFYLGILTSDVEDENEATQIFGQIAKVVYDYLK